MSSIPRGDSDRQPPNEPILDGALSTVRDEAAPHKYWTQLLNMAVDDLGPYELALYVHYVRWAGNGGDKTESIRQTARATKMSITRARKARNELQKLGYIRVKLPTPKEAEQGVPTVITVVNRWAENIARFDKKTPNKVGVLNITHPLPEHRSINSTPPGLDVAQLEEQVLEEQEEHISNASNSPLADTPITDALSDGKSTVAAQDASHQEVIAVADSTDTTPVQEAVTPKGSTRSSKRKEKAIVHPDAAAEPSPYYKPTQDERHAMFEAVCAHVFGVTDRDSIREMARGDHSRAGKIVSWLLRQNDAFSPNGSGKKVVVGLISAPAQPQHVAQFAAAYKAKHRDASLPIDIVKFTDAWRAWASQQQRKQQAQQRQQAENAQRAADAAKPRATPEEVAALKAEFEQMRRTLKEGSAT